MLALITEKIMYILITDSDTCEVPIPGSSVSVPSLSVKPEKSTLLGMCSVLWHEIKVSWLL